MFSKRDLDIFENILVGNNTIRELSLVHNLSGSRISQIFSKIGRACKHSSLKEPAINIKKPVVHCSKISEYCKNKEYWLAKLNQIKIVYQPLNTETVEKSVHGYYIKNK